MTKPDPSPGRPSRAADIVVSAGVIDTMDDRVSDQRSLAIIGERIVSTSSDPRGLDRLVGEHTTVIDLPEAAVLPAFDDTHTHLIFASFGVFDVPAHTAHDLRSLLDMIRERASTTPPGEWIRTTTNWQEINLAERRLPTIAELDSATDAHPVLVKRGGHNIVVNSRGLEIAGITSDTPDPPGGRIGRNADGSLSGRFMEAAVGLVERHLPKPEHEQRLAGLEQASRNYAATGIGTVRDCAVPLPELAALSAAVQAKRLATRVRALIYAPVPSLAAVNEVLDGLEQRRDQVDSSWLKVVGLKFLLDGGLEGGATEEPYVGRDDFHGELVWDPDELVEAVDQTVRRGWTVGTHAFGDRAIQVLLDVYEEILRRHPWLPPRSLVVEHGGLATADQRARAVALGIPVTIQHPLLHDTAEISLMHWGPERVAREFPAREWIDSGALVTAGSDFPVGQYGAMQSVWGMETRITKAGVQGPEHAITRREGISLHTRAAVDFLGEADTRGSLVPGRLADLTIWPVDPNVAAVDTLRDLRPLVTIVGGHVVHDARDS